MDTLVKEIKKRPDLKSIVQELKTTLEEEARLRKEFYNTVKEDDKAEFINGEIIMQSLAKRAHGNCKMFIAQLVNAYANRKNLGEVDAENRMIALSRNSYEPDIVFFKKEKSKNFKDDQMIFPAPDFVAEILSSYTEKIDRGIKFTDYALHGIQEYWIVDPHRKIIEQYLLKGDHYQLEFKGKDGVIKSKAIKGFSVSVKSAFYKKENLKALQELLIA